MELGGYYLTETDLKELRFKHLGKNIKIHSRASIYGTQFIHLGNNIRIDDYAVIIATGPLTLGNFVSIHNFCYVVSKFGITIEDYVTLAPGVKVFSSSDDYLGEKLTGSSVPRELTGGDHGPVIIKRHVILGAGTVVLPSVIIGTGVSVGALSLVKTNLAPWYVYAGIPVKKIRKRKKDLVKLEVTQHETLKEN